VIAGDSSERLIEALTLVASRARERAAGAEIRDRRIAALIKLADRQVARSERIERERRTYLKTLRKQ